MNIIGLNIAPSTTPGPELEPTLALALAPAPALAMAMGSTLFDMGVKVSGGKAEECEEYEISEWRPDPMSSKESEAADAEFCDVYGAD